MPSGPDDGSGSARVGPDATNAAKRASARPHRVGGPQADGGLAERVRRESGDDGEVSPGSGPAARGTDDRRPIERRLGELVGDSLVLQEAAERVAGHTIVPATSDLLREIRAAQRRLFADPRIRAEKRESLQVIRAATVEYLDHRVAFMDSCLDPGFTIEEGLDFIAMSLAEALGRWGVLERLTGDDTPLARLAREARELLQPQLASVLVAITAAGRNT